MYPSQNFLCVFVNEYEIGGYDMVLFFKHPTQLYYYINPSYSFHVFFIMSLLNNLAFEKKCNQHKEKRLIT